MASMLPYWRRREFAPDRYMARYWNSNGYACAVVAAITPGVDWAAYIGGADPQSEDEALVFVAQRGAKLSEEDARHFFPEMTLPYRH